MAQSAPKRYSTYGSAAYKASSSAARNRAAGTAGTGAEQPDLRSRYRVIAGEGHSAQHAPKLSLAAVRGFKAVVAAFVLLAIVCSVRVFMSVSTVQALEASAHLQTQIEEARATGNDLEIRHSVLANPASIQRKAAKLGMSAPKSTERIVVKLKPETKTFADGTISISQTVKSITNYASGK